MAKLGEAYVRVRADLGPFAKDLDKGLKDITDRFEKQLNKQLANQLGKNFGGGFTQGFGQSTANLGTQTGQQLNSSTNQTTARNSGRRAGTNFNQGLGQGMTQLGPIRKGLASITAALEDGFSSLPAEVKAIVGAALVAAVIPAGAFIASALSAAIVTGVAGIGIALASQFEEVEDRWADFVTFLRESFVSNAAPFIEPISEALDLFENSIEHLDPVFERVFGKAAQFVVPLAEGVSKLLEEIFFGIDAGFEALDLENLSAEVISNFEYLGDSIGQVIEMLLSNPNVGEGFSDLLTTVSDLIYIGGEFLNWSLDAYIAMKDVYEIVHETIEPFLELALVIGELGKFGGDLNAAWEEFLDTDNEVQGRRHLGNQQLKTYNSTLGGTIALTKDEEKAVKELNKELKSQLDLVNDLIGTEVDYQESVDETIKGFKEYGVGLDAKEAKDRKNIRNIQTQINDLKDFTKTQVETGEMTEAQAQRYYDNEIKRLQDEFIKRKGNIGQFHEIFDWLIKINGAPVVPDKFGPFRISLQNSLTLIQAVTNAANTLAKVPKAKAPNPYVGGQQAYADGGFITEPTMAIMGENYRPELVLPLTQPQRSAQLLAQSPLAGMMGSAPVVNVYVGNEQLESTMYRVAGNVNQAQSRLMSQKPRSI